uniref:Cytochrome P450 n=1 Tax=Panagrolaimus sp. PS1159 TaxID=55785 RepID=A0AC35FMZ9_9BILA
MDASNYPPGPKRWPIIGNLPSIDITNPHKSFLSLSERYGPVYTVWLPRPIIVIADFDILKEVNNHFAVQIAGRPQGFVYGIFTKHQKDGDGIILCQGERWSAQRRFALKTFRNFGMGKGVMEHRINKHKGLLLQRMENICDLRTRIGVIDLHLHISFCVGNIINDLVMGRHYHYGDDEFYKFKTLIDNTLKGFASKSMQFIDFFPFLRFVIPYYYQYIKEGFEIQKFFLEEIHRHEKTYDKNEEPTNFIDAYLRDMHNEDDPYLSKTTLALDAGDLWTGGLETTVTSLRWAVIYLIRYPKIQIKLQNEIDDVLDLSLPTISHRHRMPYVQATLDEILRIINVLPWGIPHETTDDVKIGEYNIKAGTVLMPQIGVIHFNEENFPNAEEFNPERFLNENGEYKPNKKFIPFGMGKRACLGESLARMELFLIFVSLLQNFSFFPFNDILPSLERSPGMTNVPKEYKCEIRQRRNFIVTDETISDAFQKSEEKQKF